MSRHRILGYTFANNKNNLIQKTKEINSSTQGRALNFYMFLRWLLIFWQLWAFVILKKKIL